MDCLFGWVSADICTGSPGSSTRRNAVQLQVFCMGRGWGEVGCGLKGRHACVSRQIRLARRVSVLCNRFLTIIWIYITFRLAFNTSFSFSFTVA